MLELSEMGCKDFASFSEHQEEEELRPYDFKIKIW